MKQLLAVTALALVLSGCGHYTYYYKDNVSSQQAYRDLYECKQASMRNSSTGMVLSTPGVGTSGGFASGSEPDEGMTNSCMQARGYTITDEETHNAQAARVKAVTAPPTSDIPTMAAQGDAGAQYKLGHLYAYGQGVPQDYAQAALWYTKAAAQGHAGGQYSLGALYLYGQGVLKDLVQAHLWLSMAAAQGEQFAALGRDFAARQMTPSQLAEAQQLAQQCQARQFKGC